MEPESEFKPRTKASLLERLESVLPVFYACGEWKELMEAAGEGGYLELPADYETILGAGAC